MKKSPFHSIPARPRSCGAGFTLVELLVAVAVLALILAMMGQIAIGTSNSIGNSSRNISIDRMANVVLDRIGDEISGMVKSGSATLVAIKNSDGNDGLALLSNGRVEDRSYQANTVRLGVFGFGVAPQSYYDATGSASTPVPMVCQGSGAVLFTGSKQQYEPNYALQGATTDVSNWMAAGSPITTAGTELGVPEPLGTGAFRFEVCFLRSDGKLISTTAPPLNKNFVTPPTTTPATPTPLVVFTSPQYPLAFNADESNDLANQTFIRAIVVGIAVIDPQSQKRMGNKLSTLASTSTFPKTADNQTPMQAWDFSEGASSAPVTYNQLKALSPTAVQYVHIYQRYYYIN